MHKRIGIIIGKVYKEINRQQLQGILEEAYTYDVSAFVFTINDEVNLNSVATGEVNLLNMINFSMLDGILYLPYTFASAAYCEYIQRFLQEQCPIPIVRIGNDPGSFAAVWHNDRAEIATLTRHLIKTHHCRSILCLTGQDFQQVSHERAAGFRDAMAEAGLTVKDEDVIFGDFWVYAAQKLAKEIADGMRPCPDAVVCANDMMALSLCDTLAEHGIRVPEDICVTGYDGTPDSAFHVPTVTTYATSWRQLGRSAYCRLHELFSGQRITPHKSEKGTLYTRESCGCQSNQRKTVYIDYNYQKMESRYLDTDLSAQLLSCDSLNALIKTMYTHQFVFLEPAYCEREFLYLCLCEDWNRSRDNGDPRRTWGYPDEMIQMDFNGEHVSFPRSDMLPPGLQQYRSPSVTLFTAIHFQDRCFGYSALLLDGIADGYTAHYLRFCREVTNALEFVRVQNELRSLAYHNLLTQVRDTMTGLYNLRSLPHIWDDYLRSIHGQRFWIGLSIGGLYRLTEVRGSLQKDKLLVAFAEQLQNVCSHGEKCLRAGEGDFLILGSEPATSHYHNLLIQNIREQFEQYMNTLGMPLLPLQYAVEIGDALPTEAVCTEQAALALLQKAKSIQPTYSEQLHYADLTELRRNIYKYPEKNWSLSACSAKLNISNSYFHRIYLKAFGVSCAHDIHRSKLEHAKYLLLHTSDTLQEVARRCGYDYSHFMRTFKKEFGLTPTEYRRGKAEG